LKSLIAFLQVVLTDVSIRCDTSTTLDLKKIERRVEHEGISFLTISLPKFGSDFEKSLDQAYVGHDLFTGFSRKGGLPRFLGGFLDLVFDRTSGRLLDDPSVKAIQAIRQITLLFSKIELRCTPEREHAAVQKFLECEKDVRQFDGLLSESNRLREFAALSHVMWTEFLTRVDFRIYNEGVIPRHGPGATVDKLRGNAKYNQRTWTRRMERVFPHWEYLIPSASFIERLDRVTILEPGDERPVKVTLVPKTLKTPRIIAVEPTCMQYMQQGVLATIVDEMPRSYNTRHFIMSKSQKPNQRLAREGSLTGALATLDLSEASDRVSNQHVRLLLGDYLALTRAVDATRSRKADVFGKTIRLAKFASMGSALCFPMEAMVFCTVVFLGIQRALNRPLTQEDLRSFRGKVRVYGDDIIVPVEFVLPVIQELQAFGFVVNTKKSFWTGRFRESCGKEYFSGCDVTVAKVRKVFPDNRRHADRLESIVALRNQMFHLRMGNTVDYLDILIGKLIPFPYVGWYSDGDGNIVQESKLLGRHEHWMPIQKTVHDKDSQIPLVKGSWVSSVSPKSKLDDYGALMKHFLRRSEEPIFDRKHLQRAGRANIARIKIGWVSPR